MRESVGDVGMAAGRWPLMGLTLALFLVPMGAGAQEEESCRCDGPRILSPGQGFSVIAPFGARPMLGVSLDTALDPDLEDVGVRVAGVMEDGPADEAGIREDDVITSLSGHALADPLEDRVERRFDEDQSFPAQRLMALIRDLEEGEAVEVIVDREGETIALTLTPRELDWWGGGAVLSRDFGPHLLEFGERLRDFDWQDYRGDRPHASRPPRAGFRSPIVSLAPFLGDRIHGLELVELNPELGSYFGTEAGVLVADVDSDSGLGLRPGDVVVGVDGREVEDPDDLRRILRSYEEGDEMELTIWRDGVETSVSGVMD